MKPIAAFLGVAALALSAGLTGASAQNQMSSEEIISNPETIVRKFSVQTVGPVLNELQMPWQVRQLDTGAQFIEAAHGSMRFYIFFTVCEANGCAGMYSNALFQGDVNPQTVQAFNSKQLFGSAGVTQDGGAYVVRYDIADYGIPRGNIAISIANFLNLAQMFAGELASSHQTVSLDGYADDLSSSQLNRKGLEHFSGLENSAKTKAELHQVGLEEGAEMVKLLMSDESVARNKIQNKHD